MAAVFITVIIVWGIYSLFELFVHRKERLTVIDKLDFSKSNKDINLNIFNKRNIGNNALRIGLLLMGIGLGLLVGFFVHVIVAGHDADSETRGIIYSSGILLFGGFGLLSAYLIEHKQRKADKQE